MANESEKIGFLTKILYLLPSLLVGLMAKLSAEYLTGRKLPFLGWVAICVMSICVGIGSNWVCLTMQISGTKATIINCTSTLLGENILIFLFSRSSNIIRYFFEGNLKQIIELLKKKK